MKFSKTTYKKPITGVGTPTLGKSTFSVEVTYFDEGKEREKEFQFSHADLPDTLPDGFKLRSDVMYWWNIKHDGSEINDIRPAKGRFNVHSTGFAVDDDDDYLVIERKGDFGSYYQAVANIEVLDGPYKGIIYPFYITLANEDKKGALSLKFVKDQDGNLSPTGNPKKYTSVAKLFNFFIAAGFTDVNIKWNDEFEEDLQLLIGALNKVVVKLDTTFEMQADSGYPDNFNSLDGIEGEEDVSEEEEEVEEKVTPKKSGKRVVEEPEEEEEVEEKPVAKKKHDFGKLK